MNAVKEKNKEMYRLLDQQNLCHRCKKAEQFPNRKFCPECLEKKTILRARYYDNFRKNEKSVAARREYQKRYREKHKSEGLCIRCNREATHGLYCYEHSIYVRRYEERRKERLKRQRRERGLIPEYRKEHNLCLFCGAPIDTTKHGRACSKCAAKFATHGNNEPLKKIINQYFTGGKQMNNTKEKSAVGAATPATEKDINISSDNIISENEEKIKAQNAYKNRMTGRDEKITSFIVKQKQPYEFKIKYAEMRIREFISECDRRELNTHVSVGGLDSITLFLFIKSLGIEIPGISVSVLEDKTVQTVHRQLGLERLKPYKSKVDVIREFGFPVLSKEVASKIELLQNPSENNKTVRHAIITGETGAYGGYRTGTRMKLAQRWLDLFGGYENDNEGVNYQIPPFKVSSKCCYYLKEKPADDWAKKHNSVPFLGLMASEGGRRQKSLMLNGCNYFGKSTIRSAPFAIFNRSDLLRLALELEVPVPAIYGEIRQKEDGTYYTTKAQRTGCSMCGFGIQLEKRPHRFDYLRQTNPKEWEFWMYRCCTDSNGSPYGWGRVLDYIGISWEDDAFTQLTFGGV